MFVSEVKAVNVIEGSDEIWSDHVCVFFNPPHPIGLSLGCPEVTAPSFQ